MAGLSPRSWWMAVLAALLLAVGSSCASSETEPTSPTPNAAPAETAEPGTDEPESAAPGIEEPEAIEQGADSTEPGADPTEPGAEVADAEPVPERVCLDHDKLERCAEVFDPAGTEPRPLLLDLHGWTSTAGWQRGVSGFEDLAAEEDVLVAWPEGIQRSFNAGGICCQPALGDEIDDVGFLRALVDELTRLDGRHDGRVYVTGLSNGCAMAQRFAVEASDVVDAVACFAFYLLVEPPVDAEPVPVMEIHARNDPVVPYQGWRPVFAGAEENLETWADHNGCDPEADPPVAMRAGGVDYEILTHSGCEADTVLLALDEGGHLPYPRTGFGLDTTRLAWEFLSRHG